MGRISYGATWREFPNTPLWIRYDRGGSKQTRWRDSLLNNRQNDTFPSYYSSYILPCRALEFVLCCPVVSKWHVNRASTPLNTKEARLTWESGHRKFLYRAPSGFSFYFRQCQQTWTCHFLRDSTQLPPLQREIKTTAPGGLVYCTTQCLPSLLAHWETGHFVYTWSVICA